MDQITPYVERIHAILQSSPLGKKIARFPVTSFVTFFSLFFHLLCLVTSGDGVVSALAVSPSATLMNGKIWTLVTSALVENNTTKFGFFAAATLSGCYYLELEGGSVQLAKLLSITTVASAFLSAATFVAVYMTTLNEEIFFSNVYGLGGLTVSVLIAFAKSQRGKGGDGNPFMDRLFLIPVALAGYAMLGLRFPLHDALLVIFSFLTSIAVLKSDDFAYRHFFPLSSVTDRSTSAEPLAAATPLAAASTPDPTKERYRARGFQLLDKKLAELEAAPEIPLDLADNADQVANKV